MGWFNIQGTHILVQTQDRKIYDSFTVHVPSMKIL